MVENQMYSKRITIIFTCSKTPQRWRMSAGIRVPKGKVNGSWRFSTTALQACCEINWKCLPWWMVCIMWGSFFFFPLLHNFPSMLPSWASGKLLDFDHRNAFGISCAVTCDQSFLLKTCSVKWMVSGSHSDNLFDTKENCSSELFFSSRTKPNELMPS